MEWKYTKDNPLRVFTAFSGYDSQCIALRNIGIPFDLVGWSEIDKYAIQAHDAIFPEYAGRNFGDIAKIQWGGGTRFRLVYILFSLHRYFKCWSAARSCRRLWNTFVAALGM